MKSYAVLLAPEFRLQATLRYSTALMEEPVALLKMEGTKPRLVELNATALAFQVQRGMTPTQALARCPNLHLLPGNAGHEQSAQDAMLQTAETLSPHVESTQPGVVTVELPLERAFRRSDLMERQINPLRLLGLDIQLGIAGTPDLALLAARFADPVKIVDEATAFLAPLPVAALQPGEELAGVLHLWGIRTIGQFVALPAQEIWDRLGPTALPMWERATGGRPRPLKLVKPQEFFAEQADLDNPVEMLEPLLFLLRRFLEQITTRLANVYLVAGQLRLSLRFEKEAPYHRVFIIPQPTRDVSLLFRMLHTHLESFTSDSPIIGLELAAKPVRQNEEQLGLLDRGLRDPHQFAETLARLQALLGPNQVGSPEIEPSHHPEAFRLRPYDPQHPPVRSSDDLLIGTPWLRFRPPLSAQVILNEIRPAFLYSSRTTGPIQDARGPWLLEGAWWENHAWAREEWDITTEEGMYRLVQTKGQWFLDGIYA